MRCHQNAGRESGIFFILTHVTPSLSSINSIGIILIICPYSLGFFATMYPSYLKQHNRWLVKFAPGDFILRLPFVCNAMIPI
ncbi:hypothetical protein EDC54_101285 [Samsonia erythrinae]|uniref:Uncharacterized protein n=1 Tax=Samsonia erythrinae TaxID=160434 RepID=A0A4R3VTS3_9GAMM|nr:hypothetical protein EDC54_101285 [Samsonia erythrinae]